MSDFPKKAAGDDWAEQTSQWVQRAQSEKEDQPESNNMAEVFHPNPLIQDNVETKREEDVFSSRLPVKSGSSMDLLLPSLTQEHDTQENRREGPQSRPDSPSYMSMKTNRSMEPPHNFNTERSLNLRGEKAGTQMSFGGERPKTLSVHRGGNCSNFLPIIENWTREHVQEWLVKKVKVSAEVAKKLYDQDVSGAALVCFEKMDFLDAGLTLGPAVQILKHVHVEKLKRSVHPQEGSVAFLESPQEEQRQSSRLMTEGNVSARREELSDTEAFSSTSERPCPSSSLSLLKELRHKIQIAVGESSQSKEGGWETFESSVKNKNNSSLDNEKRIRVPRPFDQSDPSFTYAQNDLLPLDAGPSNLIDPVREYQVLPDAEETSEREILFEFSKEMFCFAASCMNSRTNGTIHFGVKPGHMHGQVIGEKLTFSRKYFEEYESRLVEHFGEDAAIARACIRPPKLFQVQCPDGTTSDRSIIEVDVVPTYSETQEKVFYTCLHTDSEKQGQQCKNECLFIRQGSKSINILAEQNPKTLQEKLKRVTEDVKRLASARMSAEEREEPLATQKHEGQKLKQLMTHGRDSLENSLQVILVTDKCHTSQLDHLLFLKEMKLFAVLEFDPESDKHGVCAFYRKDRVANIHYPRMYNTQDNVSTVIGKLNLFQQTSWVFCNGRANEESEADKPFSPGDWLKKRAGEISDVISFLCNPDILSKDRLLVIFMLHSQVTDISSPIMETFCAVYRTLEGEDNIVCLCKDATVFKQWKNLIETRCKVDITNKCIYDLSLNEIDCTIRKLKEPKTQCSTRYLPSTGSSSVLLTKKDEDLLTVLDVLSENECESTEIETMETFDAFKTKTEKDFYRGGRVTWWNFYLSERPGCLPFIKRDIYDDLYDLITPTKSYTSPCVMLSLFHPPGCGGTTLAMHVLWNLRRKFRCAVLKNSMANNSEIAVQVIQLLNCGKHEQSSYTPVLLLVDNWEDMEGLKQSILSVTNARKKHDSLMVIILNCERTHYPLEGAKNSWTDNVSLTNKLSVKEQKFFAIKLKDLESHHDRPETFYAFMIMTNNFCEDYIKDLVCNTLKDLDTGSVEGRLLSFLSLLNTYVNASCLSLSLCEQLVGIRDIRWKGRETFEVKMNPYSTLLIRFTVEEHGTYQAVRFLHPMIAKHCLKALTEKCRLSLGEIATNLLHCDLLYKSCMGRDPLVQNVQSMLITRHRKEEGDDKDTHFSPLIEDMQTEEGTTKIVEVLVKATGRFDKNPTLPQALARHFYRKEEDFTSALMWARVAKEKRYNSYIADTLGQVYKSHLKYEIEHANNKLTPEGLEKWLQLADKGIKAFKDSQELAKKDASADPLDLHGRRRRKCYNTSGYVGETEVMMMLLDVLEWIPFFNPKERHKKDKMLQFLKDNLPGNAFHEHSTATDGQLIAVLSDHKVLLVSLKPRLKEIFNFFENYFTYFKPRSVEKETADNRNKRKLSGYFKKYIHMFCPTPEERMSERDNKPNLSLQQKMEIQRHYLEEKRADSFAGLLQCLSEKSGNEMEFILKHWQCVVDHSVFVNDKINFILANIVLHSAKPRSTQLKRYEELVSLLNDLLQEEGTNSNRTELYYLAMLLMWPRKDDVLRHTTTYRNISTYLTSTKKSFKKRFSHMLSARNPMAHFFMGTSGGLKRLISKGKLDKALNQAFHLNTSLETSSPHQLWQNGQIWQIQEVQRLLHRVTGKTENADIYVNYDGNVKMVVRPVYLGSIRGGCSQERVTFYLGFTMEGPVAYDIKYDEQ